MKHYRLLALVVIAVEFNADSPEHADELSRTLSLHDFEEVEWVDTALLVKHGTEFVPVPEYTTRDLWSEAG